eukprot:CAMPEP_0203758288 /NCGR_PEP_ID=MMETSP0098-20131031/11056_1 /ASSEMBLY_ACC=CAM_ASM_000208 /TAXON_ID=96639 /ORGANISM=" , Strain NY0313808BC1" /LENGTH=464 /DNA_ID=CAMNT_0050650619 /DNA_START=213 /DNA_END=1604 /DNA_ORIENTATION=+
MKLFKKKDKGAAAAVKKSEAPVPVAKPVASPVRKKPDNAAPVKKAKPDNSITLKLAARIEDLESKLARKDAELQNATRAAADAVKAAGENGRVAELEKQLEEAVQVQTKLREANKLVGGNLQSTVAEKAQLERELKDKQAELDKSKAMLAGQVSVKDGGESEQVAQLKKDKQVLERQLVDMTGMSIMNGDLTQIKSENNKLKRSLEESENARVELERKVAALEADTRSKTEGDLAKQEAAALVLSLEKLQAENTLLKQQNVEQEEMITNKLKESRIEVSKMKQQLVGDQECIEALEAKLFSQKEAFERAEKQRVAALDGQTVSLLAQEREKVQLEEREKKNAEIEQLLEDQRQAMEALVSAVRAEEGLRMDEAQKLQAKKTEAPVEAGGAFAAFTNLFARKTPPASPTSSVENIEKHEQDEKHEAETAAPVIKSTEEIICDNTTLQDILNEAKEQREENENTEE